MKGDKAPSNKYFPLHEFHLSLGSDLWQFIARKQEKEVRVVVRGFIIKQQQQNKIEKSV